MVRTARGLRLALLAALAVLGSAGAVRAADQPLPGKLLLVRDTKVAKVVAKSTGTPFTVPTFGGPNDPTANPSSVVIDDLGSSGVLTETDLATGLWRALGNPPGSRGYVYSNPAAAAGTDPVRRAVVKSQVVKVVAKDDGTLNGPAGGAVEMFLTLGGDTYCARFGGTTIKNLPGIVKRKDASAPADCSLPGPAVCGNGVAEAPDEECDDGGTSPGDGCNATCQLESANPALCAGVASTSGTSLSKVLVAGGLTKPVFVTAPRLDPNRVFIVEKGGTIRIVKNGTLLGTPFLDLTGQVSTGGEQGLLSMAFDRDYETNGRFYVSYTAPVNAYGGGDCPSPSGGGDNVVSRFVVSGNPDVADDTSETVLLTVDQPYSNHNGGLITFDTSAALPNNNLFLGVGDGGSGDDPCESAQNPASALGKLLRFDVTGTPPINPVASIWAIGLRNPWRFSFDRLNGDLYIGDVGQNAYEELNYQAGPTTSGVDYQWDDREARHCHEPTVGCLTDGTPPVLEIPQGPGCSVTGGYVYRGCAMPDIAGRYFYADYCDPTIRSFQGVSGGDAQNVMSYGPLTTGIANVVSFGEDARGELYVSDYGDIPGSSGLGEVYKLIPGP
jgi:cysteine-rich repeat protein